MSMIEQSFIFLDGIATKAEKNIWHQGINNWKEFLEREQITGISRKRKLFYDYTLRNIQKLIEKKHYSEFLKQIPQREHWRLYNNPIKTAEQEKEQETNTLALDIETSGYYGDITVVGLHNNSQAYFLVKNKNLSCEYMQEIMNNCQTILTFNGLSFDVPVLKRFHPQMKKCFIDKIHIDLRHVSAKLGYKGGLKVIEKQLGLSREDSVDGMSGEMAIILWQEYIQTGNEEALEQLLKYNEEDVKNLFPIAETLIPQLWKKVRFST